MNLLLIANQRDYENLCPIIKELRKDGIHVYLPHNMFGKEKITNHAYSVDTNWEENAYQLSIEDLILAIQQEKLDHTITILNYGGEQKVDAALFFNSKDKIGVCEKRELFATLNYHVPVYTYQKEAFQSINEVSCLRDTDLVHNLDQDLTLIAMQRQKSKKKVR